MPQFVTIAGCEAQPRLRELGIAAGEDTHTLETLDSALAVAAHVHSVKSARVLYRDTSEWLELLVREHLVPAWQVDGSRAGLQ